MSKKNNRQKDKRYIALMIAKEKRLEDRRVEMRQRKENARIKAEET